MIPKTKDRLSSFYDDVIDALNRPQTAPQKTAFIVVSHVLPDSPDFIEAVGKLGRIAAVIPKTSYRDPQSFAQMSSRFNVPFPEKFDEKDKPKDQLRDPQRAVDFIRQHVKPDEKLIILDHGGYFAPAYKALMQNPDLRQQVVGIAEATENGHQKYDKTLSDLPRGYPHIQVFSRARSILKAPEDHNVGVAIVHSTEGILRNVDGVRIEDQHHIGIFGFGKIGRSIAQKLQREGHTVTICDLNPITTALAVSMGFRVAEKETVMAESDLIFCATGNRCLRNDDWAKLKDGVYIASATSDDDEFDMQWLQNPANCSKSEEGIPADGAQANNVAYQTKDGKIINLLMNGKAVNFVDKSVLGPSVFLPEAETLGIACHLLAGGTPDRYTASRKPRIQQLPLPHKEHIAALWMRDFVGLDMVSNLPPPSTDPAIDRPRRTR